MNDSRYNNDNETEKIYSFKREYKKKPRVFFGWWTILVTGIISGLGHGFYSYGFSVFFKDLASELGISRATTSLAAGIGRLEGGITSPLTGWLSDRYGPKWVIFGGTCLMGMGLILMYYINSVWNYIIVWGVIAGVGLNIGLTISVEKSISNWFIKKLGMAQGIKFALIGIVATIAIPTVSWLVFNFGWRFTCLVWGMTILASTPLILIFVKQKIPEHYGFLRDGAPPTSLSDSNSDSSIDFNIISQYSAGSEVELSFKQGLKTSAYWMLCLIFSAQAMTVGAPNIHLVPFLTDMGIDRTIAGGMMGIMVFCTIPSRFFGGMMSDRVPKNRLQYLLAGVLLLLALGFFTFLSFGNTFSIYVLLICFGISSGAFTPLVIVMISRYFGRKAFGVIIGSSLAIRAPLTLTGPVFAGWVFDTTGDYYYAIIIFAILISLAVILSCLTKAPEITKS